MTMQEIIAQVCHIHIFIKFISSLSLVKQVHVCCTLKKNQADMYVVHLSWTLSRVANCLLFNGTNQTWWRSRTQTKGTKNQAHQKAVTEIRKENRERPTTCWRNRAGQTKELHIVPPGPQAHRAHATEQDWINLARECANLPKALNDLWLSLLSRKVTAKWNSALDCFLKCLARSSALK
jgi:hypothetical protein